MILMRGQERRVVLLSFLQLFCPSAFSSPSCDAPLLLRDGCCVRGCASRLQCCWCPAMLVQLQLLGCYGCACTVALRHLWCRLWGGGVVGPEGFLVCLLPPVVFYHSSFVSNRSIAIGRCQTNPPPGSSSAAQRPAPSSLSIPLLTVRYP